MKRWHLPPLGGWNDTPYPLLEKITLHQPPISSREVRATLATAPPEYFPRGGLCGWCGKDPLLVIEMWPIEFSYEMDAQHTHRSHWVYCCCPNHAVRYMMSWFDERKGGMFVGL